MHDITVAGPIVNSKHTSKAKTIVSAEALNILSDPGSSLSLNRICDCGKTIGPRAETPLEDCREKDLDDQTEAGFAQLGQMRLKEVMPVPEVTAACDEPEQTDMAALEDIEMDLVEETLSSIFS